jgi:hypothetical protein
MLLLCYSITVTKANENNFLFKKIVTGGNENATLGQVISGYKKIQGSIPYAHVHVGIRIPRRLTTSVNEDRAVFNESKVYPNPTNQDFVSYDNMDNLKFIIVTDLFGKIIENAVDYQNQRIYLPYRGVFYIKFTTNTNNVYTSSVIFK